MRYWNPSPRKSKKWEAERLQHRPAPGLIFLAVFAPRAQAVNKVTKDKAEKINFVVGGRKAAPPPETTKGARRNLPRNAPRSLKRQGCGKALRHRLVGRARAPQKGSRSCLRRQHTERSSVDRPVEGRHQRDDFTAKALRVELTRCRGRGPGTAGDKGRKPARP